jgi:hypothetical protein
MLTALNQVRMIQVQVREVLGQTKPQAPKNNVQPLFCLTLITTILQRIWLRKMMQSLPSMIKPSFCNGTVAWVTCRLPISG